MMDDSIICALSTPPGTSGIGIVRLSGQNAVSLVEPFFRATNGRPLSAQKTHRLVHGRIFDDGDVVDEVLVSVMRAPHSYTTEDVVEINCHGGIVPLRRALELMLRAGARLAEPGEFTRRAFLGGRIDLAQAEAVADLINAKTAAGLKAATNQLEGRLSERIESLRERLVECLARIEASIDFPEDEVPHVPEASLLATIRGILLDVEGLLETFEGGRLYRDGVSTVIVGKPNVGKSSILNAILEEPRAIVTEEPGTTRDVIVESVDLHGIALRLSDTAGIREPGCEVERLGVGRSERAIEEADLALFVVEAPEPLSPEDLRIIERLSEKKHIVVAANKIDLKPDADLSELTGRLPGRRIVRTSATERTGIAELEEALYDEVTGGASLAQEEILVTRLRHRQALEEARTALEQAAGAVAEDLSVEFIAIDVREALDALGKIVGAVVTDEVLNRIFEEFCIGK
jgi:tRNA modification GTPase